MTTRKLDQAAIYLRIAAKAERAGDRAMAERYRDKASLFAFQQRLADLELFDTDTT